MSFTEIYFREQWVVLLCALAVTLAVLLPSQSTLLFKRLSGLAAPMLRFHALAPLLGGVLAFALGLVPSIVGWTAPPAVHDEISYLLAADTFLHGRLANPTPFMWRHFQTMHELMVPTYASKFPPGQGIALAIGTLLGSPRVGAFGAVAMAIAATCWMLRAALPAGWALAGALLAAVIPTIFFWGQSFWGGGVAMLGGALLAGAVLRAMRHDRPPNARVTDGLVIGIGAAILMNSRPFEGALLSVLLGAWLLLGAGRGVGLLKQMLEWSAPVMLIALLPVLAWMGYYNYRVTGDVLRLPYAEHAAQYMHSPVFFWQKPNAGKTIDVPHLEAFFRDYERPEWEGQTTPGGFCRNVVRKLGFVIADAFRPIVLLPAALFGGWLALKRERGSGGVPHALVAASVCVGVLLLHFALTPWLRIQYLAVIAPMFILFVTQALRELDAWWDARPIGSALMFAMLLSMPVHCLVFARLSTRDPNLVGRGRERIIHLIESQPGNHVVFVQYPDGPQAVYEWVYNGADIDSQRVIWVHALDPASNTALLEHYAQRSVWELIATRDDYHARRLIQR